MGTDCTPGSTALNRLYGQSSAVALPPAASNALPSFAANTLTTDNFSSPLATVGRSSTSDNAGLQATPSVTTPEAAAAPSSFRAVTADFNRDGKTDLLTRNYATGQDAVWLSNGSTYASSSVPLLTISDLNWQIQAVDSFTGSAKTDILWRNYATGQDVIWKMNGTTFVSASYLLPTIQDLNWHIQGTADFTGDGKPEILWRNYATGQDLIWSLNVRALSTYASLPSVAVANLRIQAVADFNGDGNPDILWRNYLSGEDFIWSMSGMTIASTTFLPAQTDLNWQIQGAGDTNGDAKWDILWR